MKIFKKIILLLILFQIGLQAVDLPEPNYDDIEASATIGFAVILFVSLLEHAKNFFK